MAESPYVATERLYLNQEGEVVSESSVDRVSLLVGKGGSLPYTVAVAHGLVQGDRDTQTEPNAGNVAEALAAAQADNEMLKSQLAETQGQVTYLRAEGEATSQEHALLGKRVSDAESASEERHKAFMEANGERAKVLAENKTLKKRVGELEDQLKAVKAAPENKAVTPDEVENK